MLPSPLVPLPPARVTPRERRHTTIRHIHIIHRQVHSIIKKGRIIDELIKLKTIINVCCIFEYGMI